MDDGETGIVTPPGDVPALREALERLAGDADLRARMGKAGREKAIREHSVAEMVGKYAALYLGLSSQVGLGD